MAIDARSAARTLSLFEAVRALPGGFSFFSVMRQIDAWQTAQPRLGKALRPADEAVRLGQEPDLAFPPTTLSRCDEGGPEGRPPRVYARFLGMFGPNGALPLHLTEFARDRERNSRDPTFSAFTDVFHHRLLLLFYRAWRQGQPVVQRDRADDDELANQINALIGLNAPSLGGRDALGDEPKRYFAGHFARQNRNPGGLMQMAQELLDLPVKLIEMVGTWVAIPAEDRTQLGINPRAAELGRSTIAGRCIWTRQSRFRLRLGPMNLRQYLALMPGHPQSRRLASLVQFYCGLDQECEVNLVLNRAEVPKLGLKGHLQLGRNAWLTATRPRTRDADEYRFILNPTLAPPKAA